MPPIASLEDLELRWLHAINCGESDFQDALASFANDPLFGVPAFVLLGLLLALTARGRGLLPRALLAAVLAVGLVHGVREVLWRVAPRARPGASFTEDRILRGTIERRTCAEHPDMWVERGHPPKVPSFPSSHTITAAAAAAALWGASRRLSALGWLYAVLVGWGRLYWGKHWPTDVVGSLVLGALAGWVGWKAAGIAQARWRQRVGTRGGGAPPAGDIPRG